MGVPDEDRCTWLESREPGAGSGYSIDLDKKGVFMILGK